MKNEKGATSLEILLTVVILLIIAGTAVAMIAGSFKIEKTQEPETNQLQQEIVDEENKTKEEE